MLLFFFGSVRDRRKLTFYFIAEKRIDFRELVRELFRYLLRDILSPVFNWAVIQIVQNADLDGIIARRGQLRAMTGYLLVERWSSTETPSFDWTSQRRLSPCPPTIRSVISANMPHIGNSYRCRTLCKRLALIRETWKPRNDTRYHYFLYHQILNQTCARAREKWLL